MTRGSTAQSCSSGGLAHHGLAREPHAPSRRVRPAPVCGEPCVLVAPSSRRGAQGQGLLRGAAQPDLPRAVRAAPGAAPAPSGSQTLKTGRAGGRQARPFPGGCPGDPAGWASGGLTLELRVSPRRPFSSLDGGSMSLRHCAGGRWVCVMRHCAGGGLRRCVTAQADVESASCVTAQVAGLRHCAGGRWVCVIRHCAGGGLRPCVAHGGRADAAVRATSRCLRAPARVHRPPRLSEPASPRFAGSHGRHLLRSQQSPSGPAAGARAVVQPGPAPGHEETHVYAAVAEPRAFSAAGRGSDGDPRTRPGRSAPSAPTNRTEPFLHP